MELHTLLCEANKNVIHQQLLQSALFLILGVRCKITENASSVCRDCSSICDLLSDPKLLDIFY